MSRALPSAPERSGAGARRRVGDGSEAGQEDGAGGGQHCGRGLVFESVWGMRQALLSLYSW